MIIYKLQKASPLTLNSDKINAVVKTDSETGQEWTIPFDEANTDYQAYLKWLDDPNNQPLPADE